MYIWHYQIQLKLSYSLDHMHPQFTTLSAATLHFYKTFSERSWRVVNPAPGVVSALTVKDSALPLSANEAFGLTK